MLQDRETRGLGEHFEERRDFLQRLRIKNGLSCHPCTILQNHKGQIILVVGHSNTVPELIANLGASKKVPPIAENEYDNIYIISIPWFGKTKTIRLRFGEPYVASQTQ